MRLERQDLGLIGVGVLATVVAGFLTGTRTAVFAVTIEQWTALLNIPIFLAALYFISRFSDMWEGAIARGLQLVGLGLTLQILLWIPHILWHTVAMPGEFAPGLLGITPSTWLGFYHFSTIATMALVAYGFRLLHTELR